MKQQKSGDKVRMTVPTKGPGMLFRNGSVYQTLAILGSRGKPIHRDVLVRQAVKATGKTPEKIKFDMGVLLNKNHKSNRSKDYPEGRVRNDRRLAHGLVKFVCVA